MIKLAVLLVCCVLCVVSYAQRPGFLLPVQLNQQQIQDGPYFVRVNPYRRGANHQMPVVAPASGISNFPGFYRLPAGLHVKQSRPPQRTFYLVPANAIPAQNKIYRPQIVPQAAIPAEDEEECLDDEPASPVVEIIEQ